MLTIHDAQMAAFAREMEEDFKARAVQHLAERHGDRGVDLRDLVERGLAAARAHGLGTEAQAVAFIELCLVHGLDFHTRAPAADILSSSGTPEQRLRALSRLAPPT